VALGDLSEHHVDGVFSSRRINMQFANCSHYSRRQKEAIMYLQAGGVDKIRTHMPSFPGYGAFATEAVVRYSNRQRQRGWVIQC
jgi:hypothetical protein